MEQQLKRIADALERLVYLKECEVAGLVEADDEQDDDERRAPTVYLNGTGR